MSFAHATAIRPTREEAHDLLAPIYGWFTEALRHARSEIGQGGAACAFHHVRAIASASVKRKGRFWPNREIREKERTFCEIK
jgi:hypothetical protein